MTLTHLLADAAGRDFRAWLDSPDLSAKELRDRAQLHTKFEKHVSYEKRTVINWHRTFEIANRDPDDYTFDHISDAISPSRLEHVFYKKVFTGDGDGSNIIEFQEFPDPLPGRLPAPGEVVLCRQTFPLLTARKCWSVEVDIQSRTPIVPSQAWVLNRDELEPIAELATTSKEIQNILDAFAMLWHSDSSFAAVSYRA